VKSTALFFILINFHWSSPETDYKNKNATSKLWEKSLFDFCNSIHVARNNSQDTFQSIENQGNTVKSTTLVFYLINFHWSSPETDCQNENSASKLWRKSLFDFLNSIHVARSNSQDTFQSIENQGKTMKTTAFYFNELPLKLI